MESNRNYKALAEALIISILETEDMKKAIPIFQKWIEQNKKNII